MDQKVSTILQEMKHKVRFPPRERISTIKGDLAARGLGQSGAMIEQIARAYLEFTTAVLDEFTKIIIQNADKLNLKSDEEILSVVNEATQNVFREGRSYIFQDFAWSTEFQQNALVRLEKDHGAISEHLQNLVKLRALNLEPPNATVQVTGGQIGNLVVGTVNQSQLTASVQKIIRQGGPDVESAQLVEKFIELVGQMDEAHKEEQTELYDLTKGLIHQMQLPKEDRSRSTIQVIMERMLAVAKVSIEVVKFLRDHWDKLLPILFS